MPGEAATGTRAPRTHPAACDDEIPMPPDDQQLADALARVQQWPVDTAAVGVTDATTTLATHGPTDRVLALASVTKPLTALGVVLAAQYGDLHLDEPAGPAGSTVRHVLAHASGLGPGAGDRIVEPERRRVYSNHGYDLLGELVADRTGVAFQRHLRAELFEPLGMSTTSLDGSPAHAASSTVDDLLAVARELLAPDLLDDDLVGELASPQWPDLDGVVPGYGRQTPCPWGLGVEVRGGKDPHWTGPNQPAEVVGHFGQSGTFLWIDRAHGVAAVALTDRDFGPWAVEAWAPFNDHLASALGATT